MEDMKPPKPTQQAQPKRHTVAYRPGWLDIAYCTTCGQALDTDYLNKHCEGKAK